MNNDDDPARDGNLPATRRCGLHFELLAAEGGGRWKTAEWSPPTCIGRVDAAWAAAGEAVAATFDRFQRHHLTATFGKAL